MIDEPTETASAHGSSKISGLTTPAVLIDARRLEANIDTMAARVRTAQAELWPHIKTHKSAHITDLQLRSGASGATAATLTEAELLADHGVQRILVAYPPVGSWRLDRLTALADQCDLVIACDDPGAVLVLEAACAGAGVSARYLWEIDCGLHRCGTPPGPLTADAVTSVADRTRALTFAGLMTFPGHAYAAANDGQLRDIARDEVEAILSTAGELADRGVPSEILSIGSTPTMHHMPDGVSGMVVRPGNYVYYDATQVALNVVFPEDCALTVLASVVSRPSADRLILDAGSKALSTDRMTDRSQGYGIVIDHPQLKIVKLFEEHAIVHGRPSDLRVGDRVRIIPNHACAVSNLHRCLHVVDDDTIRDTWPIGARGWTRRAS